MFQIKRIYDTSVAGDGKRILVDRLWPRGISKERAKLDDWMKEIAPSSELRKWFGHSPERFEKFKSLYLKELRSDPEKQPFFEKLIGWSKVGAVTLLFGAKSMTVNHAIVLKEYLESIE